MQLRALDGTYSILRFSPDAAFPDWIDESAFYAVSRTAEELSVVCETRVVRPGADQTEADWRCMRVEGTLDFTLTGILAGIATPLAAAGISIFAVSTFDTDYVLVKASAFDQAKAALRGVGFTFAD
jgi:uncharacterized protein